ncbi:hypothetical protein CYMTET_47266 [Cymbomonas tetramitiformis]|uniref:RPA-interacting protein C-terminal domain-containing protein n=1 Tax=Cymbomonas tetramitiformis TaxID=36881 RepID=A0AAE0BWG9_9CHLO|nr:hypothetical protein CYMTET_47266 [Cymbomonas tetramitiformis]
MTSVRGCLMAASVDQAELQAMIEDFEASQLSNEREAALQAEADGVASKLQCPICNQCVVLQNRHVIFSSCGRLRVPLQHEQLSVQDLSRGLTDATQEHKASGCRAVPEFCQEERFGIPALYMKCHICQVVRLIL